MKKRIMKASCLFVFLIILLSISIQNKNQAMTVTAIEKEETSKIDAAYGIKINQGSGIIEYNGDTISFDANFENGPVDCEVGLLIFVNGIPQKYFTDEIKNSNYIIPIKLIQNTRQNVKIHFKPISEIPEGMLNICIGSMLNPSVKPDNKNFIFGNNHKIFFQPSFQLQSSGISTQQDYSPKYKKKVIPDEIKSFYIHTSDRGEIVNALDFTTIMQVKINNEATNRLQIKNGKLNCDVEFYGGKDNEYILSAYINHNPASVFDGKQFLRLKTSKGNMSIFNINCDLDKYNLDEYNTFYIVAIPITGKGNAYKLDSCLLSIQ